MTRRLITGDSRKKSYIRARGLLNDVSIFSDDKLFHVDMVLKCRNISSTLLHAIMPAPLNINHVYTTKRRAPCQGQSPWGWSSLHSLQWKGDPGKVTMHAVAYLLTLLTRVKDVFPWI